VHGSRRDVVPRALSPDPGGTRPGPDARHEPGGEDDVRPADRASTWNDGFSLPGDGPQNRACTGL